MRYIYTVYMRHISELISKWILPAEKYAFMNIKRASCRASYLLRFFFGIRVYLLIGSVLAQSPVFLRPLLIPSTTLRKLYFHFLSHGIGYDHGDSFPFDFEPNENPFGSKSKGKLPSRSYPIQFERK